METDLIELSDSDNSNNSDNCKNNANNDNNANSGKPIIIKEKKQKHNKKKLKTNSKDSKRLPLVSKEPFSKENLEYKYKTQIEPDKVVIDRTNIVKENDEIILIQKDNISYENENVMNFIKFCIDRRLFDDTFYDFGNAFSIMATKLTSTFDLISLDGKLIENILFIEFFKNEIHFDGDIENVYNEIDKDKKGHITWEDFIEFFIPFVRYVTI